MSSRDPLTSQEHHFLLLQDAITGEVQRIPTETITMTLSPNGERAVTTTNAYIRTTDGHVQPASSPLLACRIPGCPHQHASTHAITQCGACANTVCRAHAATTPDGIRCAACLDAVQRDATRRYWWSLQP